MAEIKTNVQYLDMAGLQVYDGLIKGVISQGDAKSLKSFQFDETTRTLKFFKTETPVSTPDSTPDFSMVLPEQDLDNFLEKIAGGVKDNIVIIGEGGIIVDSGTKLSDLAKKSEVGDITTLSTTFKGNLVGAINEVKGNVETVDEENKVTIETANTTEGALKSYTVMQGGTVIGVIDIPKDLVVTSGSVIKNPEGQEAGTYIKLVIANQIEPLFINVGTLVDIYKAQQNATQIQLSINSSTREISATIIAGSVGTTELADNAVTTVKIADANITLTKLADDVTSAFEPAGAVKMLADGQVATNTTDITALKTKVETLEGTTYVPITKAEINALFGVSE